jgi:peptidoglycan hydrolase-like protein with peptidoglycan-binding domain
MKKIIRIKESELVHLIKKFLNENKNIKKEKSLLKEYYNFTKNLSLGSKGQEVQELQELLKSLGYNLGTSGIYGDGIDGDYGGKTSTAISNYQSYKGLKQTGVFTPSLGKSLISDYSKGLKPGKQGVGAKAGGAATAATSATSTTSQAKKFHNLGLSKQVIKQLEYLETNKLMSNEKFTILDDINSQVHTFEPGYNHKKTYYVITGKDASSDKVVLNKFYSQLWQAAKQDVKNMFKGNFEKFGESISNCLGGGYKDNEWTNINATPSGLFKRTSATFFDELARVDFKNTNITSLEIKYNLAVYGKKYMSFETMGGKEIATAFHGTQTAERVSVLEAKDIEKQSCKKRKMSKGCVNFKEPDVIEISKFITPGQKSIWLPSANPNDIINVASELNNEKISPLQQYRSSRYYTNPGKI